MHHVFFLIIIDELWLFNNCFVIFIYFLGSSFDVVLHDDVPMFVHLFLIRKIGSRLQGKFIIWILI